MNDKLIQVVKAPLVHFMLIGAAIYGLYGYYGAPADSDNTRTVTITAGEIQAISDNWIRVWNRPPTSEELSGTIDQTIREKVLSREAVAMGLDKGDVVIRRRLAQKLQYLSNSLTVPEEPTEQELEEWYAARIDNYKQPDLFAITQIYFNTDRRKAAALKDAEALRDLLNALDPQPDSFSQYGDPLMLQNTYQERSVVELSNLFGRGFVDQVITLEPGPWFGPILSGYGVHVVRLASRWIAPDPALAEVEELVRRDMMAERAEELSNLFVESLVLRYDIVVEETAVPITTPAFGKNP